MRPIIIKLGMVLAIFAACPLTAQTALDRVDPTQEEERAQDAERVRPSVDARIGTVQPVASVAPSGTYTVSAIMLVGLVALETGDFADILESYAGRKLSGVDLVDLSNAIASRARAEGYLFATAAIPPQPLGLGILRLSIDEGAIDEIRLEGEDDPAIRAQLAPLLNSGPVTLGRLERQVLLADDISGVRIRRTRYEREGERGVLLVETTREYFAGRAEITNDGSEPVGPLRARIDVDLNGLISPFDEVDLTFSTNPVEPGELQFASARYTVTINSAGTEISTNGSYSVTRPGSFLTNRDIFGESTRVGVRISHPVLRSRTISAWVQGTLELRDLRQDRFGTLVRHDRIPVARVGIYGLGNWGNNRLRGRIEVSQGLDILNATQLGDPLASRDDAAPDFTTVSAWAEYRRRLDHGLSVAMAGRGQISSEPLLIAEDLGIGGPRFLRGYNFSERTGDEGIMGFGELRYDWRNALGILRRAQFYGYADGGVVSNLQDGRGGGSLASAGGGIRTDITRELDFNVELAVPLTGPRFDSDDESPRVNVSMSHTF